MVSTTQLLTSFINLRLTVTGENTNLSLFRARSTYVQARAAHTYMYVQCILNIQNDTVGHWPGYILNSYLIFVNSSDSLYMALSGSSLEEVVKPELRGEWESEKKIWFPSLENYAHDLREPGKSNFGSYLYFQVLITNRLLLLVALLFV